MAQGPRALPSPPVPSPAAAAQPRSAPSGAQVAASGEADRPSASRPALPSPAEFEIGRADGLGSDFSRRLIAHIERFKRYPGGALSLRLSGTTRVALRMDRHGGVLAVWILDSSGSTILDQEAMDTVRRAAPLPAAPEDFPLTVDLLLSFRAPDIGAQALS